GDAVVVGADHHDVVGAAALGVGDDVGGPALLVERLGLHAQRHAAVVRLVDERLPDRVGRADDRDAVRLGQRARDGAGLVGELVDDHGGRAGGDGVVGLHGEEAAAALDQRDVARREAGEVVGLAAAADPGGVRVDGRGGGG